MTPEERRAQMRAYHQSPEGKAAKARANKKWRQKNHEKLMEDQRARRASKDFEELEIQRSKNRERMRRTYADRRDHVLAHKKQHRAKYTELERNRLAAKRLQDELRDGSEVAPC
jgi:hypothetical protein